MTGSIEKLSKVLYFRVILKQQHSTYFDSLILIAILVVALWPLVFGMAVMKCDAMDLYLPWKYFITDTLSHNQLPLWNPFINAGFSQMGDPGTWYPVSWGVAALFGGYSMGSLHFEYLLHLYLGGLGFYFLLKQFGLARVALLSCATGYMLSGVMIGNAQHLGWVVSAAWLPWVVMYFLRVQQTPSVRSGLKLALVLFFQLSGGYPGIFIVTIYTLVGFFILESVKQIRAKNYAHYQKQWLFFGISSVFFLLMSSVVLIAAFDMAPLITRGTGLNDRVDVWNTLEGSFSPEALLSFLYPLATTKNDLAYWGADLSMTNAYFGVLLLLTILAVVFQKDAPKNVKIFFGIGILFLLIAMGKSLPVRTWTTYLPFMDSFRFPSLFRLFALFFFLFSAGFSLHYLSQSVQVRKVFNRLLIVAMICFGIYNIFLFSGVEQYKFMQIITIGWLHFLNVSQINELIFLQAGVLMLLMGLFLLMCKFKLFGDTALGWKKAFLLVFVIEIVAFTWMNRYATVLDNRSLNDASVGMDTLPEGFPTPSSTLPLTTFNDVNQSQHFDRLWKNLSIYFKRPTYDGISPYTYTNMVRAMETGEFDKLIKYPIYFFAERLDKNNHIDTTTIDTLSSQKFWVETFSPNELRLHVELPDASKFIYLQNYYPSWTANVNGTYVPIIKVSETFMAVDLPKGKSTLVFSFDPKNVIRASFVSISMWAGVILYLFLTWIFFKRGKRPSKFRSPD
jgi:hypothetical protein